MAVMTVTQITAVSLTPNPVAARGSYTVVATVTQETVVVAVNPLFEFPMDIGSNGLPIGEFTW